MASLSRNLENKLPIYKIDIASTVDYEKLLRRCMISCIESEGCCWGGENDPFLTEEERIVAARIYEETRREYEETISPSSLLHGSLRDDTMEDDMEMSSEDEETSTSITSRRRRRRRRDDSSSSADSSEDSSEDSSGD